MCVAQADYYRILTQGERSIQCIEEGGEVVMVTEFRKTDGGSRQGQVVIKVCFTWCVYQRLRIPLNYFFFKIKAKQMIRDSMLMCS